MGQQFDNALWREAMGGFPTGVTVVTSHAEDGSPAGTAVNAFCSLSISPPLLLVCLGRSSRTLETLRRAGSFCVNVLSDRQGDIVERFARKDETGRFDGVPFTLGVSGDPLLSDTVAWFDCRVHEILDGGDHEIVIGEVAALSADSAAAPLAYHRGRVQPFSSRGAEEGAAP